jgi:hypothetical protein
VNYCNCPDCRTKSGTFGTVDRNYTTDDGVRMVLVRWGALGWLTPAPEAECKQLASRYESEAKDEARAWVRAQEESR